MATLNAMMGSYPKTAALKEGVVVSPLVQLEFAPVDTAQTAFKEVVRELKFDVAELAIMTFLQAFDAGKPYRMLPFVMNGNFHHKSILCRADDPPTPRELAGKTVAMRAYTQTTPAWVRGILADEYDVDLRAVRWVSQEGAHVADYIEPEWVTQMPEKRDLEAMLLAGEVDAIISGGKSSGNPGVRQLIPDAKAAALAWYERTHAVPINHVVVVRESIAATRNGVVPELFRMLCESRAASGEAPTSTGPDLQPIGFDALAPALDIAIRYAFEQKLISRRFGIEELYGDVAGQLA
ncbi:phosphate ABC transporter substrate-binding protein [Caballeronia sp. HLA56]